MLFVLFVALLCGGFMRLVLFIILLLCLVDLYHYDHFADKEGAGCFVFL